MTELLFGLGFFVLILVSIALHEIGHLVPAKLFGVRVPEYFVGFGRRIWSIRRGGTEYGLKWIPLGGYVRLLGMYPPAVPRNGRPSRWSEMADAAREVEWQHITEADVAADRLLYQKKTWQKVLVMFGGPAMNLLIAFFVFWAITGLYGAYRPQPVVAGVQECILAADATDPACAPSDPRTPATLAGLKPGDRVVAFNGVEIAEWSQLTRLIRANLDGEARLVVERDGTRVELPAVHTVVQMVPDELDPSTRVAAGWLGVSPVQALVKGGPGDVLADMWTMTVQSVTALVQFPVKVVNVVVDLVTGQPRDVYSPLSILGASRIAGEVAADDQLAPVQRVVVVGSLLGSLNLFLAIFNLVPLPPLDGGHIAGALYEGARRRIARLLGREDPGHFDTARMLPVAYGVAAFLILCGVALILADILSPIQLS